MKRSLFFSIAMAVVAVLAGCKVSTAPTESAWKSQGKPKVLVSFAPIYSFATSIAGDDAEVKCLLATEGPHFHGEAKPQMLNLASGCDVLFVVGLELENEKGGLVDKLKSSGNPKWNVVELGAKFSKNELMEGSCKCHKNDKGEEVHEHGFDPHIWLSIKHAKKMCEGIRDELKRLDPSHAAGYDQRTEAYMKKLDSLLAEGVAMLKDKKERSLLSFHDSLNYFGDTFNLTIVDFIEIEPGVEPTQDKLKDIIKTCQENNVRVITVEPSFSNKGGATIIKNALLGDKNKPIAAEFAEVDPIENCEAKDLTPELYENRMRANFTNLAKVLK